MKDGDLKLDTRSLDVWLETASRRGVLSRLAGSGPVEHCNDMISPRSVYRRKGETYALMRVHEHDLLLVLTRGNTACHFEGKSKTHGGMQFIFCPLQHENAVSLREALPHTAPRVHRGDEASFGTGDRLGIASPGHIHAVSGFRVFPVFAQQSARELELTCRSFEEVIDAATWAVFREGYNGPWGGDGDHLKTEEWVRKARSAGCTMITADVSDYIREKYAHAGLQEVRAAFGTMPREQKKAANSLLQKGTLTIERKVLIRYSEEELLRTVCVFGEALLHAAELYRACLEESPDVDFELSVDETAVSTTPIAHLYISMEMERMQVPLYSVAPRFAGSFQKALDYEGDLEEFERSLRLHGAIARQFGHRVSVHSGSDKFRIFSRIGTLTGRRFHLKTSGTSWLEALKVILEVDPQLFLSLYCRAKEKAVSAMRYYTVSFDPKGLPDASSFKEAGTSAVFRNPGIRQLLHVTYGEVLKDPSLKRNIYSVLQKNIEFYWRRLEGHMVRHLDALQLSR